MGPLHSDRHYDISASKEGFVLSPLEGKQGDFKAFALAGVTFKVAAKHSEVSYCCLLQGLLCCQLSFGCVCCFATYFEMNLLTLSHSFWLLNFLTKQLRPFLPSLSVNPHNKDRKLPFNSPC